MSYVLSRNILATLTYYDVLDMPLSAFEIWKHLMAQGDRESVCAVPISLYSVYSALHSERLAEKVSERNGFYFLTGRSALVDERIAREKISVQKLKRLKWLIRSLVWLPYVRMIGVTGSLSMKHSREKSDWDVLVILREGRIWTGRTVLTAALHSIGKRRHHRYVTDRVCLNHFMTDDHLEVSIRDLFSAHECRFLIPLLNFPLFQKLERHNGWVRHYMPNFSLTILPSRWLVRTGPMAGKVRRVLEYLLDFVNMESTLSVWQKEKISRNPKTYLAGSHIEVTDHSLIFLPRPRGPEVFERFKKRLSA